jgi:hypothetical protein
MHGMGVEGPQANLVLSAMSGGRDDSRAVGTPTMPGTTFELDRFTWAAPDRLELAGRFAGIGETPGDAILVVRGLDWVQRLPAVPGTEAPDEHGRWRAAFAWLEAPAAFDGATLELGDELSVDLPAPRSRRRPFHHELLEVRRHDGTAVAEAEPAAPEPEPAEPAEPELDDAPVAPEPREPESSLVDAAVRLRLQADLLAAREEARQLQTALERANAELARTRADLETTRTAQDADAERFRDGLASVRAAAEETLAGERTAVEQARADARAAIADAEAGAERQVAEARADAEDAVAAGERQAGELERLRSRLAKAEQRASAAEQRAGEADRELSDLRERAAAIDSAREQTAAVHADAEQLLEHLTAMRDRLGPGT